MRLQRSKKEERFVSLSLWESNGVAEPCGCLLTSLPVVPKDSAFPPERPGFLIIVALSV